MSMKRAGPVPLLKSRDVVEWLGLPSTRVLDSWSYRGTGPPFVRVGRHRRYRPEAVETWLAAQERGGSQKSEAPTQAAARRKARPRPRRRGPGPGKVQGRGDGDPRGTS